MVGIGLIGFGHWGPNHARVFNQLSPSSVRLIVDTDAARLAAARQQIIGAETSDRIETLLAHPQVDAVVIATPTVTHYEVTRAALEAGKDVLVEKPLTSTAAQADELIELAERKGRVLMCAHVFLFNAGIRQLQRYISGGVLGRVYYMAATRTNLGPLRTDVNALYDLASHDVSIFHYLLEGLPQSARAWGQAYLQPGIEDVTFACLEYPNRTLCHMHVSWLNPRKERTLVVVGDTKMAVWDDTSLIEPIRLYDKGFMGEPYYDSFGQFQLVMRDADVLIPRLPAQEPLKVQNQHFLDCVRTRQRPLTDGPFARNVVASIEALQASLADGGARQPVHVSVGAGEMRP